MWREKGLLGALSGQLGRENKWAREGDAENEIKLSGRPHEIIWEPIASQNNEFEYEIFLDQVSFAQYFLVICKIRIF